MPWELIIPIVIDLIKGCMEDTDKASVTAALQSPGLRERWAFRKAIVQQTGVRGRALRDAVSEGMEMLRDDPTLAEDLVAAASGEA